MAKIRIEYNGKTYRVGKSHKCASKRDCDLFERGVCDSTENMVNYPCEALYAALAEIGADVGNCFKEVAR